MNTERSAFAETLPSAEDDGCENRQVVNSDLCSAYGTASLAQKLGKQIHDVTKGL